MDNVFRDLSHAVHSEAELALGEELGQRFEMLVARYMHAQEVLETHSPGDTHARRYAKGGLGKFGAKTDLATNTSPMLASILIEAEVPYFYCFHLYCHFSAVRYNDTTRPRNT
jgi:hypothetical protein